MSTSCHSLPLRRLWVSPLLIALAATGLCEEDLDA